MVDRIEKMQILDMFITLSFMISIITMAISLLLGNTAMAIIISYVAMGIAIVSLFMWFKRRKDINKILDGAW